MPRFRRGRAGESGHGRALVPHGGRPGRCARPERSRLQLRTAARARARTRRRRRGGTSAPCSRAMLLPRSNWASSTSTRGCATRLALRGALVPARHVKGEARGGMKARGAVGEDGVNSVRGRGGLARLGGGFCPLSVGSDRTCRPIYLQIFIRYGTYRSIVQIGSKVSQIRTSEQIRLEYIAAMGEGLGEHFHGLWEEVVDLHLHWREYVDLFGTSPERVNLLNQSASSFFARLDGIMWEQNILHIYRLTDSPRRGELKRLTLNALPDLVASSIKKVVRRHLEVVRRKAVFCRDWRERLLAHRDLDLTVGHGATPLILGSRKQVEEILLDMAQILNLTAEHYTQSSLSFEITRYSGAERLIRVLHLGLMMEQRRIGQMDAGGIPDGGYRLPYL